MALLEASIDNKASWIPLPTPSPDNYSPTYTHLERSYQDSVGYLHRDIIRRNRAKIVCGWNHLNSSEMALLQTLYNQDYIYLRFTDNYSQRREIKCYAGPVDGKTKFINPQTYELTMRTDVTCDFIEY
jgi:hypothetical protein